MITDRWTVDRSEHGLGLAMKGFWGCCTKRKAGLDDKIVRLLFQLWKFCLKLREKTKDLTFPLTSGTCAVKVWEYNDLFLIPDKK